MNERAAEEFIACNLALAYKRQLELHCTIGRLALFEMNATVFISMPTINHYYDDHNNNVNIFCNNSHFIKAMSSIVTATFAAVAVTAAGAIAKAVVLVP